VRQGVRAQIHARSSESADVDSRRREPSRFRIRKRRRAGAAARNLPARRLSKMTASIASPGRSEASSASLMGQRVWSRVLGNRFGDLPHRAPSIASATGTRSARGIRRVGGQNGALGHAHVAPRTCRVGGGGQKRVRNTRRSGGNRPLSTPAARRPRAPPASARPAAPRRARER